MAILEIKNLKQYFYINPPLLSRVVGKKKQGVIKAVDDVSFSMTKGEVIGLAGESGCGKSTTCLAVAKLRKPSSGTIHYKGKNIAGMTHAELLDYRKEVQLIFQDPY